MRALLLVTLALGLGAEGTSLGIGIDVFDRAYEFAASRVGAPEALRLVSCTKARCLFALGDGVTVTADHPVESLDVNRIEVTLDANQRADAELRRRYEQACLTVVALVDPGGSASVRREVAAAIAAPFGAGVRRIHIDRPDKDVSVYGAHAANGETSTPIFRCGAVAMLD